MVNRGVLVCAVFALLVAWGGAPSTSHAQEVSALPSGAANLVRQVMAVVEAVRSRPTRPHEGARDDLDDMVRDAVETRSAEDSADVADSETDTGAADDAETGDSEAADSEPVDRARAADGGVIPYARAVVQLFGRGVPVAPLDDLPRSGTTLNLRPCHGGCLFRLRIGF